VNTFSNFALRMKSARQYILLNGSNPFLRVRAERSWRIVINREVDGKGFGNKSQPNLQETSVDP